MPNKLSQFWQELKRRNVVRVITVYAGVAFVIIELVNNISEPLRLPEWTPTLVIVLLTIGFPIVAIISWIYDIHPEGGIVKTKPVQEGKSDTTPAAANGWRIASYISFVMILGLILLNIIPRTKRAESIEVEESLETSIAVLPFENMSINEEDYYIGGAFTDEIIMELQKISAFDRVLSRTSTMQYGDNNRPTIPEIAEKLDVNYLIEGSIQRLEGRVRIRVQVIRAHNEDHIWGESYDEDYTKPEDILDIQSRIAHAVADELKVRITPEEIKLIESVPTTSLTAYDYYQRGNEAYWRYWSDDNDKEALQRAEYFFNEALKYDSTLARAYTGLARIYWGIEGYLSENFLDTARVLVDKALLFDPELAEAHTLNALYFNQKNDTVRAMREVDRAISLNPNDWEAYSIKANIGVGVINSISNRHKAVMLNRGPELPILLRNLGAVYAQAGFFDKAVEITEEVLKLTGDSAAYFGTLASIEQRKRNLNGAVVLYKKYRALDSTQLGINNSVNNNLFQVYSFLGEKEQALKYGKIWAEWAKETGAPQPVTAHRMGYYYWLKGLQKEADYYFNQQIEYCMREIELERSNAARNLSTYYNLAATYAFTGETEKAIDNLKIWVSTPILNGTMLYYIRYDVLLDPIRDNPEFQKVLNEAEAKYQAEHERVRQWLEENEKL